MKNNIKEARLILEGIGLHQCIFYVHKGGISNRLYEDVADWIHNDDGEGNEYMTVESAYTVGPWALAVYPMGGINARGRRDFSKQMKVLFGLHEMNLEQLV